MLTIIFGKPRKGKTALMTKFAIDQMTIHAKEDLQGCRKEIEEMTDCDGYVNLVAPEEHCTFANYKIKAKREGFRSKTSYYIDGFQIGLENDQHEVVFLVPHAKIFLAEAQRYFNSREKLPSFVSRWFETHAHNYHDVYMDCQRPKLIDLNIREIVDRFIKVLDLKHYYNSYNERIKSVWTCLEFYENSDVEDHVNTGNLQTATKVEYTFEGDIFKSYSSRGCKRAHRPQDKSKAFDLVESSDDNQAGFLRPATYTDKDATKTKKKREVEL